MPPSDKLKRTLGLPSLLFYGVGVIIGAGIYSIVGAAAGHAGRGLWLSLLLAAVPALLTALCYAELSTRFPRAGASYVYVREALPQWRWPSFMIGFIVACTSAATAATVAIAFGGYLSVFVEWPQWLAALLLLGACTIVNVIGIRESAWVTAICTAIEVCGLALIIGAGVATTNMTEGLLNFRQTELEGGGGWSGIFTAAALSFFVFTGFEGLANLAEETKKPKRNLPWALMVSLAFTTILYVLVAIAATALLEPSKLAQSDSPLSAAAETADPRLGTALAWIALFATANTALITVVVGSRLLYGMATEGDMPGALANTLPRRRTPWTAALVIFAAATGLLPLGEVAVVGSISSLLTLIDFAAVGAALMILRLHGGDAGRRWRNGKEFRVPLSLWRVPLVPVLLIIAIIFLATQFTAFVHGVSAAVLVAGILLSFTRRWWKTSSEPPTKRVPVNRD